MSVGTIIAFVFLGLLLLLITIGTFNLLVGSIAALCFLGSKVAQLCRRGVEHHRLVKTVNASTQPVHMACAKCGYPKTGPPRQKCPICGTRRFALHDSGPVPVTPPDPAPVDPDTATVDPDASVGQTDR